jgi:large subunit ribosomal protein L10
MKDRQRKQADLEALRESLEKKPDLFVTGFDKLSVAQDFQLRKAIRQAGGIYHVIKNTLAEKASAGTPSEKALSGLKGTSAVALTHADPVALVKVLTKYAKEHPTFSFKAGVVEGRVIDLQGINELSTLPPKEEIYAKLLFLINAPAQRLVTALSGVGRNLAVVVDQGVKENKFSS